MKITRRILSMTLTLILMFGTLALTASADEQPTVYGVGFVNASSLRLRSEPNTSCSTLTLAPRNECVVVLDLSGDWYKVNYNLQVGYMHRSYLSVLTRENAELGNGRITGTSVNLRSGPSTSHSVLTVTQKDAMCYIIGVNNGWYKVIYNGTTGYISSTYVALTEIPYENQSSSNSPKYFRHGKAIGSIPSVSGGSVGSAANSGSATGSSVGSALSSGSASGGSWGNTTVSVSGSDILAEAQKYLGIHYVYGGASPAGFDCSGFVYYVLKQVGISAYRTPADQYRQGTYIEKSDLQVGDIVFFAGTAASGISHVGIYAGGGQFIHSPNSRSSVSYSDLTSGYWAEHYYGARRMN